MELGRARSLRDPMAEVAKDLTPPQLHTLMWLHHDGALPITALAHRVHCAAPTITGVIDRLEREGLVARQRDANDRRVVQVQLTPAGAKMAKRLDGAIVEQLAMLFTALSDKDGDALLKIATRLVDTVRDHAQSLSGAKVRAEAQVR